MKEICDNFEKEASVTDILLAIILLENIFLRWYYTYKFPYGTSKFRLFLSKLGLASPPQNKDEGELVEPLPVFFFFISTSLLASVVTACYFRWDQPPLDKVLFLGGTSFFEKLEAWIICSGELPNLGVVKEVMKWIGLVILQVCFFIMHWTHAEMRENWTPTIHLRKEHKLVTGGKVGVGLKLKVIWNVGPFRYVRNPMYGTVVLYGIGCGLACWNWIVFCCWVIFVFGTIARIRVEERVLQGAFGSQYTKFKEQTKYRLIPFIY